MRKYSLLLYAACLPKVCIMLFNSVQFLLFFPVVITLYFVLPKALKNAWLLIASYFFYMCWNPVYGALLLFATVLTYFGALAIECVHKNRGGYNYL